MLTRFLWPYQVNIVWIYQHISLNPHSMLYFSQGMGSPGSAQCTIQALRGRRSSSKMRVFSDPVFGWEGEMRPVIKLNTGRGMLEFGPGDQNVQRRAGKTIDLTWKLDTGWGEAGNGSFPFRCIFFLFWSLYVLFFVVRFCFVLYVVLSHWVHLVMVTRTWSTLYLQRQFLIYTILHCAYSGNVWSSPMNSA